MKLIVGLGNPGNQYTGTRHNVGFMVLDSLGSRLGIALSQNKFSAEYAVATIAGERVCLIKPMAFMNLSGESVRQFAKFYQVDHSDILVIHDDLDIGFGSLKLSFDSGAAGHNGIRSIIDEIGSKKFHRLRVGISKPEYKSRGGDYVLKPFLKEELDQLEELIKKCCLACEVFCKDGAGKVRQEFHGS
jgi:peptidyl-tRNA hydrolase, PTH1 family